MSDTSPRVIAPERKTIHRPWGVMDLLTQNETTSVKVITVFPGEELSLQGHDERSEWWIILDHKMKVYLGDKEMLVHQGDELFIPQGTKHRAIGLDQSCRWLEVSFGYFDENDIHRYSDKYGRENVGT